MIRTSIALITSCAAFATWLMTTASAPARLLPHKACPLDTAKVETAMTSAELSALAQRVDDAFGRILRLRRGPEQHAIALREADDWVCGLERRCGQYTSIETGMGLCLRNELSKRADILEYVAEVEELRRTYHNVTEHAVDGSQSNSAAVACPTQGEIPDCPILLDLAAETGATTHVTGQIGKIHEWIYSVSVAAGDMVRIRFTGPRGAAGTIRCPEDPDQDAQYNEGEGPFDARGALTSKAAGHCLISIGFDGWVEAVPGPFNLSIERR